MMTDDPGSSRGRGAAERPRGPSRAYLAAKRAFDVAFSALVVAVGAVPCALLAAAVRLETPGSPLYLDERVGRGGRPVHLVKLRTMVEDAWDVERHLTPEQLAQWESERKVDADPRVTRVGRLLRATSLDELPQFLNVLKGDLSVIGPRPVTEGELAWFGGDRDELLSVRPGITGWWQVTARNDATFEGGERQKLEMEYVRGMSPAMDARVFLKTFSAMFSRRTGK